MSDTGAGPCQCSACPEKIKLKWACDDMVELRAFLSLLKEQVDDAYGVVDMWCGTHLETKGIG